MFDTPSDIRSPGSHQRLDDSFDSKTVYAVRETLFRLADAQERIAAGEAALVPYWKPCPESVTGPRAAARALRAAAEMMVVPSPRSAA
jgi:hypothetical protein